MFFYLSPSEGRPPLYSREQKQHALELLEEGRPFRQVEKLTGISKATLVRYRQKLRAQKGVDK